MKKEKRLNSKKTISSKNPNITTLIKNLSGVITIEAAAKWKEKYSNFLKKKYGCFFLVIMIAHGLVSFSQIPKSGTYTFKYCDLEYENGCYATCKVVIKKDSIVVYATKELSVHRTSTNQGDIIDKGIILKHQSGKWIVGKTQNDIQAKQIGVEGPAILDFKKKEYWTF